ncbi:MAG: hypothetical protein L6R40_002645 [Gallowayella cf. fulva]|nr:MAG: hypothetical protein L6R40_002645 [Xanthomendoza cf. fulva]
MPPRLLLLRCIQPSVSPLRHQSCFFHANQVLKAEDGTNHYKTLGLDPSAAPADVKKQFYNLSKKHHPDRNRNDPHAAERFVEISEAYAILGDPSKRERYDRETGKSATGRAHGVPRGSHSSSAPYGARPASGLSRRRTQFHGPPPSFYRSGGWGVHGAKRQRQADATASAHASASSASRDPGTSGRGGFGPAGPSDGLDYDVSHFDRDIHIRTQEQQDERRKRRSGGEAADYSSGENMIGKFLFVSGILAVACLVPSISHRIGRQDSDTA